MIEVNGLVKCFDGFAALDGATLSVPAGSVYGLVGPNGAGKSTLIRHLTGIFRQDAGTVRISGQDVWENAALKARIAAIPDDWYYFLQSSIRDMMRFYRGFYPDFSMERYEKLKEVFHKPVMANVSGFSVDDYAYTCEKLDREDQVGWLEVNISCPNVHNGGMAFGVTPEGAAEVTRAVKAVTKKPVIMKLSPNVTDVAAIARSCEAAGADGISLINTVLSMRIDLKTKRPVVANVMGGLSGPAVFPLALRMVWQVCEAVSIPVVGMGGVSSAEDVIEMMLAGATAVEVGAANLVDPCACQKIVRDLPRAMEQYGINDLKEIIGGARHG